MNDGHERTMPIASRWDQEDAEFVRTDTEWCSRLATRLVELYPELSRQQALQLAHEMTDNQFQRARSPEHVADDLSGRPGKPLP